MPKRRAKDEEIDVDLFAGGGGASEGIRMATGRAPYIAINHDAHAIRMHEANHPDTIHLQADVFEVKPRHAVGTQKVRLLWASPSCTHFSRARGGAPKSVQLRSLGWVVVDWARDVRPRIICAENVVEWTGWCPIHPDDHPDERLRGQPIEERRGETWRAWVAALEALGYAVEWRSLTACDYGAPTSRTRLFVVARRDGLPIVWPSPTHGPADSREVRDGLLLPFRTAAECIDWSIPVPSIFDRTRPLAPATERRIAEGIRRYVLNSPRPFIIRTDMQSDGRLRGLAPLDEPLRTITTSGGHAVVTPTLIQTGYGEREGQAPRVLDIGAPLGTVVAGGAKHALVAAWMVKHFGGVVGHGLERPLGTVTAVDHHSVGAVFLDKLHGSARAGQPLDAPAPTVTSGGGRGGGHAALVAAFLCKYYGSDRHGQPLDTPLHTIPTVDRFGLVTVQIEGEPYTIIGMRMLQPRELATAQGFGPEYRLIGTKSQQVARIGNSVSPYPAAALVRANVGEPAPVRKVRRPPPDGSLFGGAEMAAK